MTPTPAAPARPVVVSQETPAVTAENRGQPESALLVGEEYNTMVNNIMDMG